VKFRLFSYEKHSTSSGVEMHFCAAF